MAEGGTAVGKGTVEITADSDGFAKGLGEKMKAQSGAIGEIFGGMGKIAGAALLGGAGLAIAAGAGLAKLGESFDAAYDTIRITTGKTGTALSGLQDDFKAVASSVPVDLGQAGDAVALLNQKLGDSGKPLQDISVQLLNLSRMTKTDLKGNIEAVAGTFNQWGVAVGDQSPKLDELFRISQQTGVSFQTLSQGLSQGGAQFRAAGLTFEESGALIGLLAKNGLDAGAVIPALGKAMATAAKEGKPAAEVFQATFDKIKNAPNDVAGAQAAIDVFGAKAGPKFAELIREGKLSYEDFATSISAGGDTINAAASQTDDWREKLKLLMNKAFIILEPLATKVFSGITTAIDKVTPYFAAMARWLSENLPKAMKVVGDWIATHLVPVFQAIVAWVRDHWPQIQAIVVLVFTKIRDAILYFVTVIVPKVVAGFKATFAWLMDNKEVLIGIAAGIGAALVALFAVWVAGAVSAAAATIAAAAPFIAIGVAIAAVVAGVLYAYNHFKTFHDVVDAVGRAIKTATGWLMDHKAVLIAIAAAIALVVAPIPTVVAALIYAWTHFQTFRDIVMDVVHTVQAIIEGVVAVVTDLWQRFGDDIVAAAQLAWGFISGIVQAAVDVIVGIFDFFRDLFTGKWGKLWGDVQAIVAGVWLAIETVIQATIDAIVLVIQTAWDALKLAAQLVWDGIKLIITGVWDAIKLAAQLVWSAIQLAITTTWDTIKAVASTVWEAIKAAVMAPINALEWLLQAAWDAIKSAAATAWDLIQKAVEAPVILIQIAVQGMIDFFKGIWDGIEDAAKGVWDGVKSIVKTAVDGIKGLFVGIWDGLKSGFNAVVHPIVHGINLIIKGLNDISPFGDIPTIPENFHSGGTVAGTVGIPTPIMALAGETVRTTSQETMLQAALLGAARNVSPAPSLAGPGQGQQFPDTVTLIIEGTPFTAIVQKSHADLAGTLRAGQRR